MENNQYCGSLNRSDLDKILTSEFGISSVKLTRIETGETNEVYVVDSNNYRMLLKIVQNHMKQKIDKQQLLQPLLMKSGIRVPKRVKSFSPIVNTDYSYIIDEWIPSKPASNYFGTLLNHTLTQDFVNDLKVVLTQVHAMSFLRFGDINKSGEGVYSDWQSYLSNTLNLEYIDAAMRSTSVPKNLLERSANLIRNLSDWGLKCEQGKLVHGDMNLKNILVDSNTRILGVVDWDESIIGDPLWDYASMWLWYEDRMPIWQLMNQDLSITSTQKDVIKRLKCYRALQAIRESINYSHKNWAIHAWQRLHQALEQINF